MKQAQICHLEKSSKADLLNNYRIFLESQAENEKIWYVIQHNFVFLQKVRPFTIRKRDELLGINMHVQRQQCLILIYYTIKIMHKNNVLARLPQLSCMVVANDIK